MYIEWSHVIILKIIVFLSLKIYFVLSNSADPDEMLLYVTFHLGLHGLRKYLLIDFRANNLYIL